jgi:Rap1a immunity proteins
VEKLCNDSQEPKGSIRALGGAGQPLAVGLTTALLSEPPKAKAPGAKTMASIARAAGSTTMNLRQCLVLIGILWPVSAFSAAGDAFFTGDMLHRYCNQSSESCTNYIAGVVDALIAVGAAQKVPLICLHDRTELGQAVDVIANYLRAHPEKRHVNAASVATVALKHAFPYSSHQRTMR